MLLFNSLTSTLLVTVCTLFGVIYAYFKWTFKYWERRGVPSPPAFFPAGHIGSVLRSECNFGQLFTRHYYFLRGIGARFGGGYIFVNKVVVLADLELAKCVLQKDFGHFMNHGGFVDEETDPLAAHLFSIEDEKWKLLREKLTPTFTSGKMKMMFHTMAKCSEDLVTLLEETKDEVNIKEAVGRFTTDIIMSAAFGIEANCLKDAESVYRKYGRMANETDYKQMLKQMCQAILPRKLLHAINFKLTNVEVEEFFMDVVKKTVDYREKNNVIRKDFMHLLLQLKNLGHLSEEDRITSGKSTETGLTLSQLAAQAFVFFIAGFETSSTAMSFALYEIALHPQVQGKLRAEINKILKEHDGELSYDAIMSMKYLDKVVHETLRKYPPLPILFRNCNKDYTIPDTDVVIKEGMGVMIPILGIQHDHEYFPNPEVFDPERFSEEGKASRPNFTWLPFGEGPRVCIGNYKINKKNFCNCILFFFRKSIRLDANQSRSSANGEEL